MKTISYIPSRDELVLEFRPVKTKPTRQLGRFKLWWDKKEGNICAIAIQPFTEELKEFEAKLGWIHLSGIWKGVKISEQDIQEARQELLRRLEERGEKY
jgi:hypothetical protein